MKNMHRKAAGALLAGALLCGTAACSSDSSDADKKDSSKAAGKSAQKPVDASFAAAVERASKKNETITSLRYVMSGDMPENGHVEAKAAMSTKPLAMQMNMKAKGTTPDEGGEMEIRLVDGAVYLSAKGQKTGGGKSWIKMPNVGHGKAPGGADNPFSVSGQAEQNPMEDSASMNAAKDLEKVGDETVDGVKTTHYKGTVTLAQMREALAKEKDPKTKERREAKLKGFEKLGVDKFAMDMWIDGQDHTKQFRMRSATQKGPMDLTIKFLDYNKPVEIKAPPAGEVMDPMAEAKKDGA
ncbi:DUF1396 domain-containing protein [Streptomyces huiliensis]|uniref:DUF1396 domain-containing protein n=1 Tax=Streptomyces huiliensis TaxID=2876027 RepID=UPI001CC0A391|nr:DUF1396 domain-containing protein [Streptomyces huiliensis]MBZ4320632.1 DUF1396 domain-containing protein [Streptomyces huiliensis]